ncbi:PLP-dependent cysteine synthase family protein [Roseobacter denitrificans]|uniref:L-cysteine desulfhydrase Cds1 n=1 Tax=Roseobacter denitrificans (strain ATCC 33942 / OCh 114) TaxID=375451 RepID=Q162E6_ROSDO|nr:PLP-dependent cysteine synthase family protein [Roseobacter denitrificans]ABG33147.1 pyridoxal-phosphate dependent enzyme [Roseobacter denitrificans OCh 114]AVL52509.1 PLP-dependent cysteine synthase family protein [Roseobacter denitrificans]SFG28961.1 cysteine synthase A [Roseobacter denitrificans OCh 114]
MDNWVAHAIRQINADAHRSADTHLFKLPLPRLTGVDIYLKDESTHPTGSLKHRLARSLFLYALCNGKIKADTPIVEASSGSTAVSEAYFARMIGVPFIAVLPKSTARSKIRQIEFYGGKVHFVDAAPQMHDASVALAASIGGYFMDQFTYAERATDWRGNNNIAESVFTQMEQEPHPIPAHLVMSAGTGGTSATLGRYIRYKGYDTELTVVDPENSVFYQSYMTGDRSLLSDKSSRIEGIGRPKVELSFQPGVIDHMIAVPDAASVATMLWLEELIGRKTGPSSGTNLWGALKRAQDMIKAGRDGSIVTLLCDSGDRYLDTYYNPDWVSHCIGAYQDYSDHLNKHFK